MSRISRIRKKKNIDEQDIYQSQPDSFSSLHQQTFSLEPKNDRTSTIDRQAQLKLLSQNSFNFAKIPLHSPKSAKNLQRRVQVSENESKAEQNADVTSSQFAQSLSQSNYLQQNPFVGQQKLFQPTPLSQTKFRKNNLAPLMTPQTGQVIQPARSKFGRVMSTLGFGLGGLILSPLAATAGAIGGLGYGGYKGMQKGYQAGKKKNKFLGFLGGFGGLFGGAVGGAIGGAIGGGLGSAVGGFAGAEFAGHSTFGMSGDRTRVPEGGVNGNAFHNANPVTVAGGGYNLRGYKYEPTQTYRNDNTGTKAVIMFSGSGGSNETMMSNVAQQYTQTGATVYGINYRGYGQSRDKNVFGESKPWIMSEAGLYRDARRIFDYVNTNEGYQPSNITLHGFSLGGAVASHLAKKLAKDGINLGGLVLHSSIKTAYSAGKEMVEQEAGTVPGVIAGLGAKGSGGNFDTAKHLEQLATRDPDLPIHFMSGSYNRGRGDHLDVGHTRLDQVNEQFTNVTSSRGRGGHLNNAEEAPASHFSNQSITQIGNIINQGRNRQINMKPDPKASIQRQNNRSSISNNTTQPIQLKQENHTNRSHPSSQFWQQNSLQLRPQSKSISQVKSNQIQRKVNWGKWKRRLGMGIGGGAVAGGVGYGIGAGLASAGLLAGLGPVGWGILGGLGVAGLGYLGYKGLRYLYKQHQLKKQGLQPNNKLQMSDLQPGDMLMLGGSAPVNAAQAAGSALRGILKLATLQLRGGVQDLTTRMYHTSVGHVAIYIGNNDFAHAVNSGFVIGGISDTDSAWVYRCSNQQLTTDVVEIAKQWSKLKTAKKIEYSGSKAGTSAFRRSKFGKQAHIRAISFALNNCFYQERSKRDLRLSESERENYKRLTKEAKETGNKQKLTEFNQEFESRSRKQRRDFIESWGGKEGIYKRYDLFIPDSLFCSEAGISIYQAAAYRSIVSEKFAEHKSEIQEIIKNGGSLKDAAELLAKYIKPKDVNQYSTLHLDAPASSPQRLSAKLAKWSSDPDKTGWRYVGLYDGFQNQADQEAEHQRQQEEFDKQRSQQPNSSNMEIPEALRGKL